MIIFKIIIKYDLAIAVKPCLTCCMTKKVINNNVKTVFDLWCDVYGNQKKLAIFCGVTLQAVGQWRKRIPAERVLQIEACSEFELSRCELRPDLYPIEDQAACR